jgi:hypothetical protein
MTGRWGARDGTTGRRLFGLVLGLVATACAERYESFEPPPLSYADRMPIRLRVSAVLIESAFRSPRRPPFVEHTLVLTPEAATLALLEQRLEAVGGPGTVRAVIVDASVREQSLELEGGITGYLTTEVASRLEGRISVRVDRLAPDGEITSTVSTAVTRSRGIPEDTGYADRQRIGYELVLDMVEDLDTGLLSNLQESFGDVIEF